MMHGLRSSWPHVQLKTDVSQNIPTFSTDDWSPRAWVPRVFPPLVLIDLSGCEAFKTKIRYFSIRKFRGEFGHH